MSELAKLGEQLGERAYESAEKLTDAISTIWASGKDDGKHINLRRVLQEQCKAIDKRLAELESQVATLTAALEEEKTTLQESEQ